eukprot:6648065-Alexandrium_andersonii.AAC.1
MVWRPTRLATARATLRPRCHMRASHAACWMLHAGPRRTCRHAAMPHAPHWPCCHSSLPQAHKSAL